MGAESASFPQIISLSKIIFFSPGRSQTQNISKFSSTQVAVTSNLCKETVYELLALPVKTQPYGLLKAQAFQLSVSPYNKQLERFQFKTSLVKRNSIAGC